MKILSLVTIGLFCLGIATQMNAQVTLDGTVGDFGKLNISGPDYQIRAEYGKQAGSNLFHSFQQFDINTNESATFSGPGSVRNIISRVTGKDASWIDGRLHSAIPNANLYLLNSAGVMFGPNASVDVGGAFHVSTADYLRMGENEQFYAMPLGNEVLTTSPPTAFGFLDSDAKAITFEGCDIQFPGKTFSVIGGDIEAKGAGITTQSGRLNMASVASAGEVVIHDGDVETSSFTALGEINISPDAKGNASEIYARQGSIFIRSGLFVVDNSQILADTPFTTESLSKSVLDISADTVELKNGAHLSTDTFGKTDGADIRIQASESVSISGSEIRVGSIGMTASGNAGMLSVKAEQITLESGTQIKSESKEGSSGNAGNVLVEAAESVTISDTTLDIYTTGLGQAGKVEIKADNISLGSGAEIRASTTGRGAAGEITLTGRNILTLKENASVNTETEHEGKAGNIALNGSLIQIRDVASVSSSSRFKGDSDGEIGRAGTIIVDADDFILQDDTSFITETEGQGNAGDIMLNVGNLRLDNGASLSSSSNAESDGGSAETITVRAEDSIRISDNASVTTDATNSGGGKIIINAGNTLYLMNGVITTSVNQGTGKGGDIIIGDEALETGPEFVILNHSIIRANANQGDGGAIFIVTDNFIKSTDSSVEATSERGNEGIVSIEAPDLDITGGMTILPGSYIDATKWQKTPCSQRSGESVSHFVIRHKDASPTSHDDWQPIMAIDSLMKPDKEKEAQK